MAQNKPEQTPTKQSCQQAIMNMKTQSTSNNASVTKMENMMKGTGFEKISGTSQHEYQIIKQQFASEEFADIVKVLKQIAPDHGMLIDEVQRKFDRRLVYDHGSKNFPIKNDKSRQIKYLRIEYIRKVQYCFIGYEVFDLTFTLSPDLFLKTYSNQSSNSKSNNYSMQIPQCGGFGISSSSSHSNSSSYQEIVERDRGLNPQDLQALVTISKLGGTNREMCLDMISKYQ